MIKHNGVVSDVQTGLAVTRELPAGAVVSIEEAGSRDVLAVSVRPDLVRTLLLR